MSEYSIPEPGLTFHSIPFHWMPNQITTRGWNQDKLARIWHQQSLVAVWTCRSLKPPKFGHGICQNLQNNVSRFLLGVYPNLSKSGNYVASVLKMAIARERRCLVCAQLPHICPKGFYVSLWFNYFHQEQKTVYVQWSSTNRQLQIVFKSPIRKFRIQLAEE